MTDIDLDKLEALADTATHGPWTYEGVGFTDDGGQYREVTSPAEIIFGEWSGPSEENAAFIAAANPATIKSLIASAREAAAEIKRLRSALGAAEGRATDYRTVAINQGWNWILCDAYGREEYAKQRGEHVDACALNATEARARAARWMGRGDGR